MNVSAMGRVGIAVLACAACATQSATPGENMTTPLAITQEEVTLKTPTGEIFGTLELPAARTPVAVALLIAGSGPTDRNGNTPALPGSNRGPPTASRPAISRWLPRAAHWRPRASIPPMSI